MKKLLIFSALVLATICSAQANLQTNKEGDYRQKHLGGITAQPEALKYESKFPEAISKPGKKILVEKSEGILRLKPLFKKQTEIKECFIIYDSKTKNISYIRKPPLEKEEPSYLILLSVSPIFLMIISNILVRKDKFGLAEIAAFVVFVFTLFAFVAFLAFTVTTLTDTGSTFIFTNFATRALATAGSILFVAVFFSIFAFAQVEAEPEACKDYKGYRITSIIFYTLMTAHIILLFV